MAPDRAEMVSTFFEKRGRTMRVVKDGEGLFRVESGMGEWRRENDFHDAVNTLLHLISTMKKYSIPLEVG